MPNLADRPPVSTFRIAALTALTLAAAVGAALVLPRARPRISLGGLASREAVLDRASAFVRRHATIFAWLVRFFEPENPRETVVQSSSR